MPIMEKEFPKAGSKFAMNTACECGSSEFESVSGSHQIKCTKCRAEFLGGPRYFKNRERFLGAKWNYV